MKVVDKENNIVEDICPSCGKDGATIQTTECADGSKYIEVMCLNGCGHFARIIKRESKLINEQNTQTNEEWFNNLSTEEKAEFLHSIVIRSIQATWDGKKPDYPAYLSDWRQWLKEEHKDA